MDNKKILELLNNNKIDELKKLLIDEIKTESCTTKAKNSFKKVANHLKKINKKRIVLHYSIFKNDMQFFTDSYFLSGLKKEDQNPLIPECTDAIGCYPRLDSIIEKNKQNAALYDHVKVKDFLQNLKELKTESILNNKTTIYLKEYDHSFDFKLLDLALSTLNLKNDDVLTIRYSFKNAQAMIFEKSNGSFTLVLPVINYSTGGCAK